MKRLLKGGRVVDPANGLDGRFDVLVEDGVIARVEANLPAPDGDVQVIDVPAGLVICPGLVDMHVHLREPGQEHKETIATGTRSAVAGGFTAVACMPNTSPVNDNAGITQFILQKAAEAGLARVYPIGAVSRGSNGEFLADIAELHAAGCAAISDDGRPVATALLMRRALEYASMFDIVVIDHCEDPSLKGDGVAHEGFHASALGLRGLPGAAETIMVQRDVTLAGLTGGRVHIAHMSARGSLRAVRDGKAQGFPVTCEVAPHHFVLTDESLREPIVLDRLVHPGLITLSRAIELLSTNPARILRRPGGTLSPGQPADITVLAPDARVAIVPGQLVSKSKNTPFGGWTFRGAAAATIVGGRTVFTNPGVAGAAAFA